MDLISIGLYTAIAIFVISITIYLHIEVYRLKGMTARLENLEEQVICLNNFKALLDEVLMNEYRYNEQVWGGFIKSKRLDAMDEFLVARLKEVPSKTVYEKVNRD